MRTITLSLFGLIGLTSQAALAQRTTTGPTDYDYVNQNINRSRGGSPSVSGSPWALPRWSLGDVQLRSGNVQRQQWLKYDLSADRLLWRRPQGDSVELFNTLVSGFTLRDSLLHRTYTYRLYPQADAPTPLLRTVFFDVRYDDGQSALLRQTKRRMVTANNSSSLTSTAKRSSWQNEEYYFLKLPDNKLKPVRLAPKSILAALPDSQQAAAAAFVKSENLDLRQEADVVRLLLHLKSATPK